MIYIYHYMFYLLYLRIVLHNSHNKYYHLYKFYNLLNISYMFLLNHQGKFLLDKNQDIDLHLNNQFDILYNKMALKDNKYYIYLDHHKGDIHLLLHKYQVHIMEDIFLYKEQIQGHI